MRHYGRIHPHDAMTPMPSPYHPDQLRQTQPLDLVVQSDDGLALHLLHWPGRTLNPGPPALLLHGFTNDAHIWDPLSLALSEQRYVYALDFRGHGQSAWDPHARYLHQSLQDDVMSCIKSLKLERLHLIGHSLGARIAMLVARQLGERIASYSILDTGPEVRAAGVRKVRQDAEGIPESFASEQAYFDWLRRVYALSDEHAVRHMAHHGLRRTDAGLVPNTDPAFTRALWKPESYQGDSSDLVAPLNEQLWQALAAISAPTLLLRGQISAILSRETARRMVEDTLPRAELKIIPRAGHALLCDNPRACIAAIVSFINAI